MPGEILSNILPAVKVVITGLEPLRRLVQFYDGGQVAGHMAFF